MFEAHKKLEYVPMGTQFNSMSLAMQRLDEKARRSEIKEGRLRLLKWKKFTGCLESLKSPLNNMQVVVPTWWPYGDLTD